MIHAYATIWGCLMHDIITEIREKSMCAKQLSAIIHKIYER